MPLAQAGESINTTFKEAEEEIINRLEDEIVVSVGWVWSRLRITVWA